MNTVCRNLGLQHYTDTLETMRQYTAERQEHSQDEIWFLQHYPVFTQGTSCHDTPFVATTTQVVHSDRGGQITYHGPGQLIVYFLLDIKRRGIGPKALVQQVEQSIIDFLAQFDLAAERKVGAPGVYIDGAKIAALGFRIRRGCCYHGLSFNIDMDLMPFSQINPCGYVGQAVTQLRDLRPDIDSQQVQADFCRHIERVFA